jgi:acyl carrier protein
MSIEKTLRQYVLNNYLFTDDESALVNGDSFLERGIIDSTGILEMISYINKEYKIVISDDEMIPENLDSINNLVAFITRKLGKS